MDHQLPTSEPPASPAGLSTHHSPQCINHVYTWCCPHATPSARPASHSGPIVSTMPSCCCALTSCRDSKDDGLHGASSSPTLLALPALPVCPAVCHRPQSGVIQRIHDAQLLHDVDVLHRAARSSSHHCRVGSGDRPRSSLPMTRTHSRTQYQLTVSPKHAQLSPRMAARDKTCAVAPAAT